MWNSFVRELRPVTALSLMLDARLWHDNAFGFRLTNLLLHASGAVMVGLLAWRAGNRDSLCGFAAATLYALHPAHVEGTRRSRSRSGRGLPSSEEWRAKSRCGAGSSLYQ